MGYNQFGGGFGGGSGGGFGGGNLQQLMKQAQKMQEDIQKIKTEIENTQFTAKSGGGMVEVVLNGKKEVVRITLKKEVVDPEDVEMLEDLIKAAFMDALSQIAKTEAERLPNLPGGMF